MSYSCLLKQVQHMASAMVMQAVKGAEVQAPHKSANTHTQAGEVGNTGPTAQRAVLPINLQALLQGRLDLRTCRAAAGHNN